MGSKSSSSQAQESLTFINESDIDGEAGSTVASLSNVDGNATINIEQEGITGLEAAEIVGHLTGIIGDEFKTVADANEQTTEALSNIAMSATATQTEQGRILEKYLPWLVLFVIVPQIVKLFFKGKK